jgi:phage terminase small subunit
MELLTETAAPAPETPPAEPAATSGSAGALALQAAPSVPAGTQLAGWRECTPREELFAQRYVACRNKAKAWREVYGKRDAQLNVSWTKGCQVSNRPWVRKRVAELESEAARLAVIDVAELLERDRAIVRAAEHVEELSGYVWSCCRYCHGTNHAYQYRDAAEYIAALAKVMDDNAIAVEKHTRQAPLPSDEGGYGFDRNREPHPGCAVCGGLGEQRAVFADTRHLSPNVRALYMGVEQTNNGIKYRTRDPDKAAERLYRAAGAFGDDAASVARGAVAGAMAGVAASKRLAKITREMTPEAAARIYLEMSQ